MGTTGSHIVAVGIGSNLGDRRGHVEHALARLASLPETELLARSGLIETEPVGPVAQERFINAAATIRTALEPVGLLEHLQEIERERGRRRSEETRWGPRSLDLDILLYADRVIDRPGLTVPHPRMHEREFVLAPLAQIAPQMIVPTRERSVAALLADLVSTGAGSDA